MFLKDKCYQYCNVMWYELAEEYPIVRYQIPLRTVRKPAVTMPEYLPRRQVQQWKNYLFPKTSIFKYSKLVCEPVRSINSLPTLSSSYQLENIHCGTKASINGSQILRPVMGGRPALYAFSTYSYLKKNIEYNK